MNTSRRKFIKSTAFTVAASTALSRHLFAATKSTPVVGIQLYSVRDDMKKDPSGTLKAISDIGYRFVEHANYVDRKFYGYSPTEFKKILDGLNLHMGSGHTELKKEHWDSAKKDFTDAWKYTVEDAAVAGQKFVISPWLEESLRTNYDDFKNFMDIFNKSGELCKKSGMKFGYHNHDFEFNTVLNGQKLFDLILMNTDPSLVAQQLDIGNLFNGGGVALDVVKKWPGRFELMHVKDEIKSTDGKEKFESTILGTGIVQTRKVINIGRDSGTTYFIVEQESYQGKTPLESAKKDFAIMREWGF
ncbi:MAG: xylose isomerase [Bacteroidetes bacterium]|nr:MAG: xylose isomerase [Bacteroidota bacterium]